MGLLTTLCGPSLPVGKAGGTELSLGWHSACVDGHWWRTPWGFPGSGERQGALAQLCWLWPAVHTLGLGTNMSCTLEVSRTSSLSRRIPAVLCFVFLHCV